MLDKKALIQSLQQRSRTTNNAGEYVPYLQNEGILDYIKDTASAIGTAIGGESDADKKAREDKQAADIAKRKKELEAKGAPTTQEAPTPPAEPVTTTTTAKMSDAGVITGTEKDQEAIKKQQEKISDLVAKGELTPAQASQYGELLGKRS